MSFAFLRRVAVAVVAAGLSTPVRHALLAGTLVLAACGCSYNRMSKAYTVPFRAGNYGLAEVAVTQIAGTLDAPDKSLDEQAKGAGRDELLLRLEQGAICRAAADYVHSNLAFEHANQLMDRFDEKAKVRVGQEAGALMVNQTIMDYTGTYYDRVMASTYRALNYLEMGKPADARVELLAAYQRQQDTVQAYAKRIEEEREKAEAEVAKKPKAGQKPSDGSADVARSLNDPKVKASLKKQYDDLPNTTGLDDYVNPFSEYLHGLYFSFAAGTDASDHEQGRVAIRKVASLLPNNPFVDEDVAAAEAVANGSPPPPVTYVFFETGTASIRDEIRIDVPVFLFNLAVKDTKVDYVGVAFPKLRRQSDYVPTLLVQTPDGTRPTAVLADLDAIIGREFKNRLPAVITRSVASAVAKAAAAYAANRATENNSYANLFTRISTTIYQAATNSADLRTWQTLPKQIQVARVVTPADRQLHLSLSNGTQMPTISILPGTVNVVFVKSTSNASPLTVHQFILR